MTMTSVIVARRSIRETDTKVGNVPEPAGLVRGVPEDMKKDVKFSISLLPQINDVRLCICFGPKREGSIFWHSITKVHVGF